MGEPSDMLRLSRAESEQLVQATPCPVGPDGETQQRTPLRSGVARYAYAAPGPGPVPS